VWWEVAGTAPPAGPKANHPETHTTHEPTTASSGNLSRSEKKRKEK